MPGGPTVYTLTFNVLPDDVPELQRTAVFALSVPTGGAAVNVSQVELILRGSDNASGIFGLEPDWTAARPLAENSTMTVVVRRTGPLLDGYVEVHVRAVAAAPNQVGGADNATTSWTGAQPASDLAADTVAVVFAPHQTTATVTFAATADGQPELDEYFVLVLSHINSSAAHIDAARAQTPPVVIPRNDYPFGVLQFAVARVTVAEGAATAAAVAVVRTGGTFGHITVHLAADETQAVLGICCSRGCGSSWRPGRPRPSCCWRLRPTANPSWTKW